MLPHLVCHLGGLDRQFLVGHSRLKSRQIDVEAHLSEDSFEFRPHSLTLFLLDLANTGAMQTLEEFAQLFVQRAAAVKDLVQLLGEQRVQLLPVTFSEAGTLEESGEGREQRLVVGP